MTEFPPPFTAIFSDVAKKYPDDIPAAVDEAVRRMEVEPGYEEVVDLLVRTAVQEMIYRCRSESNRERRRLNGADTSVAAPKVNHASQTVIDAHERYYGYMIGGKTLGSLLGRELLPLAQNERTIADGHEFRAELLEAISASGVPEDSTVQATVGIKKIARLWRNVEERRRKTAEVA